MMITEIRKQKTYYEVCTTNNAVYELDGEFVRSYHLSEGMDFDEEILLELHGKSRFRRAYKRACHLLDERDYSYVMLYLKLKRTYQDEALCRDVMKQLVQCGAVNDRRYAEKLAEYLVERKHYGLYRVRQEMLHKGLDADLIDEFLDDWEDAAEENLPEVLEKKYGRILTDPKDFKSREKAIAGMARLGYNFRSVKKAIEDYFADWEEDSEE